MDDFKYYTLFGVNIKKHKNLTTTLERDFIFRWSTNERKAANLALAMTNNQLFKTTRKEAMIAVGLTPEAVNIAGIISRIHFCENISAHLFETDFVMSNKDVDIMIEAANICESSRELLVASTIKL